MKTREIDVFVDMSAIPDSDGKCENCIGYFSVRNHDSPMRLNGMVAVKAKLVIEMPEKKVEITESQFDEIVLLVKRMNVNTVEAHKQELFKNAK
jgi:hypothetical protein